MEKKLGALQGMLDRARLALAHRAGVPAERLRHTIRELQTLADFIKDHPEDRTVERIYVLAERVGDLHARVREWATENRVYYPSIDSSPTVPTLSSAEIQRAIAAMPKGASEPPPAVSAQIIEAIRGPEDSCHDHDGFADGTDARDSAPPSAPTLPRLDDPEEDEPA